MRLPIDAQNLLKSSFMKIFTEIIAYIDSYFNKNITFYQTISCFGQTNIDSLTWHQVTQCVELIKLNDVDEDRLFDEFTNLKFTFNTLTSYSISLFDQVQVFISKQNNLLKSNDFHNENDEDNNNDLAANKMIRPDQLWMFLLSITQAPNFKKLICFLYSLPASNSYVESVFSQVKHLFNDKRNRVSTELISAELKVCLNCSLSWIEIHKYLLCNQDLLEVVKSVKKYDSKR